MFKILTRTTLLSTNVCVPSRDKLLKILSENHEKKLSKRLINALSWKTHRFDGKSFKPCFSHLEFNGNHVISKPEIIVVCSSAVWQLLWQLRPRIYVQQISGWAAKKASLKALCPIFSFSSCKWVASSFFCLSAHGTFLHHCMLMNSQSQSVHAIVPLLKTLKIYQ